MEKPDGVFHVIPEGTAMYHFAVSDPSAVRAKLIQESLDAIRQIVAEEIAKAMSQPKEQEG